MFGALWDTMHAQRMLSMRLKDRRWDAYGCGLGGEVWGSPGMTTMKGGAMKGIGKDAREQGTVGGRWRNSSSSEKGAKRLWGEIYNANNSQGEWNLVPKIRHNRWCMLGTVTPAEKRSPHKWHPGYDLMDQGAAHAWRPFWDSSLQLAGIQHNSIVG